MMNGDIEKTAQSVYEGAGLSIERPADPVQLVTRVLGPGSISRVPPRALPGLGAVARVKGQWRIFLVEGAPIKAERFVLLHELAHVILGRAAPEDRCDALAAALLAPCAAFAAAYSRMGLELESLAATFGATETCVGLRLGEVTQQPTLLYGEGVRRARGRRFSWPTERELKRIAAGEAAPGLRKARLRDASDRILLMVAI